MSDILLSPEEIRAAERTVYGELYSAKVAEQRKEAICRAQVRKVVEERLEPLLARTSGVIRVELRTELENEVAALKAAGEGK